MSTLMSPAPLESLNAERHSLPLSKINKNAMIPQMAHFQIRKSVEKINVSNIDKCSQSSDYQNYSESPVIHNNLNRSQNQIRRRLGIARG